MILLLLACTGCGERSPETNGTDQGPNGCPEDQVLDGDTCVPEACGVGTWGDLPVDGETVFVAEGGTGDGTETAPLGSIQAGADLAGDRGGGLVAVSAGRYTETIAMGDDHRGVTLAGRCRELVTIDGSEGEDVPAITVRGEWRRPEVGIEGVTVTGGSYTGLLAQYARVRVESATLRENALVGVAVVDAEVDLREVDVSDTGPDRAGAFGRGVDVESGGNLTATGCVIRGNTDSGVFAANAGTVVVLSDTDVLDNLGRGVEVDDGAALTATGCRIGGNTDAGLHAADTGTTVYLAETEIRDTRGGRDGTRGWGVEVNDGAEVTATGLTLDGNQGVGLLAAGAGTQVALTDTNIWNTAPNPDGSDGRGLEVNAGASLTAVGCSVQGNTELGVSVSGADTVVTLSETQILDTAAGSDSSTAAGVAVTDGAALTATGCLLQGNSFTGLYASDAGTRVSLTSTEVSGTAPNGDGIAGRGVAVTDSASLMATDCTLQGNTEVGLYASNPGTLVDLSQVDVLDTHPSPDGTNGRGIVVQDGATLTASSCLLRGNSDVGLFAGGADAVALVSDTEVRDTAPGADGSGGWGVAVQGGATLSAAGCVLEQNVDLGLFASGTGTSVDLTDTLVINTGTSPRGAGGRGVEVQDGALLSATGCTLRGNRDLGLFVVDPGSTADLAGTEILDTAPLPGGDGGRGVFVQDGAALTAVDCVVQGNTALGVGVSKAGSTVDLVDSAILDTRRGSGTNFAQGVSAQEGARMTMTASEISGAEGPGAYLVGGSVFVLSDSELTSNTFAGVLVLDAAVTLDNVAIADTRTDAGWGGGFGVYASDYIGPPTITLTDSTIGPHPYAAIWLDGDGSYDIEDNDLSGNTPYDLRGIPIHGNAVFAERGVTAWTGSSGLRLAGNHFHDATDVAVLLDGATAQLEDNTWTDNGADVWQQRCEETTALISPDPAWMVCATSNVLTDVGLQFNSLYLPDVVPL